MRGQLQEMGFALDWDREFATCDPEYYAQQQKLFLDFLKHDLVYRRMARVNWDPVDQTVLANEQVIDGKGWRSGAVVEQRELPQWFFRITSYADDLLEGLDTLDRWPEKVRLMQKNWIGKSEGCLIKFKLSGDRPADAPETLDVFTTRHDTIFGASFCAIAPNHPLAQMLAENDPDLRAFIADCQKMGTSEEAIERAEKKGYDTGPESHPPVQAQFAAARVRRQLRADGIRHRRHLRLPGARPARPGLRAQVQAEGQAGRYPGRRRPGELQDRLRGVYRPRPYL